MYEYRYKMNIKCTSKSPQNVKSETMIGMNRQTEIKPRKLFASFRTFNIDAIHRLFASFRTLQIGEMLFKFVFDWRSVQLFVLSSIHCLHLPLIFAFSESHPKSLFLFYYSCSTCTCVSYCETVLTTMC